MSPNSPADDRAASPGDRPPAIGLVGLGAIGGCLGLDLRARGHRVWGWTRRAEAAREAEVRGIVDGADTDPASLRAADVVFLCPAIGAIAPTAERLIPHLRSETVLTDVGSVKGAIVAAIAPRWENFVGGHPMAGTHESGMAAAQRDLFVDRPYVLTPTAATPPAAVERVAALARSLGARLYTCAPDAHDRAVAAISHLPVAISAALIAACEAEPDPAVRDLARAFASSGFRDTSRVGGGNPELGAMMAEFNRAELRRSLDRYRAALDDLAACIEAEDWAGLKAQLAATQNARDRYL